MKQRTFRLLATAVLIFSAALVPAKARAETMIVTFEGLKAPIVNESKYQGAIEALDIDFRSAVPVESGSSQARTRRTLAPVFITKRYGASSSPQLLMAVEVGEQLKGVKIDFLGNDGGREVLLYSWRLSNVIVSEVTVSTEVIDGKPQVQERVGFVFRQLEVIVGAKVVAATKLELQ